MHNRNSVELLGVTVDDKITFAKHKNELCRNASSQLNAIFRLILSFFSFQAKEVLTERFIYSNFNYCPLVKHFWKATSLQKIENIQK